MSSGRPMKLKIEGKTYDVQVQEISGDAATVLVDGKSIEVGIESDSPAPRRVRAPSTQGPGPAQAAPAQKPQQSKPAPASGQDLRAMMPGVITKVVVEAGQKVTQGEVLLILEAMKMENEIRSDRDGAIADVHVSAGQKVQTGELMISFSG